MRLLSILWVLLFLGWVEVFCSQRPVNVMVESPAAPEGDPASVEKDDYKAHFLKRGKYTFIILV